jgi:hypothetical protein
LVAAVEVENTGNVPAAVTVNLKWDALPGPLFDGGSKTVTLEPGRTREIRFMAKIKGNDVDRVQSSPGYRASSDNKFCKVKTSINKRREPQLELPPFNADDIYGHLFWSLWHRPGANCPKCSGGRDRIEARC